MIETYITLKTALLIKEKGFDTYEKVLERGFEKALDELNYDTDAK